MRWTPRRKVRRISGAPPGRVTVKYHRSLHVAPDLARELRESLPSRDAPPKDQARRVCLDLLKANKVTMETALNAASNPTDLQTKLEMEGLIDEDDAVDEKPEAPADIETDERF